MIYGFSDELGTYITLISQTDVTLEYPLVFKTFLVTIDDLYRQNLIKIDKDVFISMFKGFGGS